MAKGRPATNNFKKQCLSLGISSEKAPLTRCEELSI
jgi:hypothetical protein